MHPNPGTPVLLERLTERPLQTMKQELRPIQRPLDYTCVVYLVCGLSVY